METKGGWVLEVDIRRFFDTLDHGRLSELVQHRVRDGVLLRLIGKWLNAGVLEEGKMTYPDKGTPQGGVISPLLANIYLHEVLDMWFEQEVRPRMKGRAELIRYADDFIICFEQEEDARRVMEVLPKRFEKYGLALHPEKTQLIEFRPPRSADKGRKPRSFDLLGFTHYWGKSRWGKPVVKRKTATSRFSRGLKKIAEWLRRNLHRPVEEQHSELSSKLQGHYSYYGITGNWTALNRFAREVVHRWRRWLARRSQRGMSVGAFQRMLDRLPLPVPRVVHSVFNS
jgi:group II intron reverse transcriptase/maturase